VYEQKAIEKRKQGIGGSVWYEDENGNLQKEIHIHVVSDDIVAIETVQFMQGNQFDKLKEIFKSYVLMEKNDTNNKTN
jgi:hypothetical protein